MHYQSQNNTKNLKLLNTIVIFGGYSKERPGSLISGQTVFDSLKDQGYKVSLFDFKNKNIYKQLKNADVVFIVLHGRYGEDGKIQGYLETLKIPYVGSGVLSSALGMDKLFFKRILKSYSLPTPKYAHINLKRKIDGEFNRIIKLLELPLFLKPVSEGGSLGSEVIHTKKQFTQTLSGFLKKGYDNFLAETYLEGKALTVGLIEINNKLKTLPVLETISKNEFYDYEAKHDSNLHIYKCPAKLSTKNYKIIQNLAVKTYNALGCHGFCRVDFLLDKKGNPYILEVNTIPGLSSMSNMATMAKVAGISYDKLVVYLLKTAFTKPVYLP